VLQHRVYAAHRVSVLLRIFVTGAHPAVEALTISIKPLDLDGMALLQSPLRPARALRRRRAATVALPDLIDLVRAIADAPAWEPVLRLPEGTDRWWTRLYADHRFDLWLLSWLPGHSTDLHDHGASAAAFAVVRGMLGETRVERDGYYSGYLGRAGSVTSVAPGVIHDVRGAGAGPAVSIHAYSPPLAAMNFYGREPAGAPRLLRSVQTDEPELERVR
jgi:mannose-6-phosphate isomerase-like protein (cupin superfamily)